VAILGVLVSIGPPPSVVILVDEHQHVDSLRPYRLAAEVACPYLRAAGIEPPVTFLIQWIDGDGRAADRHEEGTITSCPGTPAPRPG
jgi:hypothetical protein